MIDGIKMEQSVQIQVEKCISKAGGGALPETEIPSYGVALESTEITVEEIESRMRNLSVPVIGRIKEGRFLLDMRTSRKKESNIWRHRSDMLWKENITKKEKQH